MSTPVSPAVGDFITKTFWDTEVTNRWADLLGTWTAYSPTWSAATTPPSIGNGTLSGAYQVAGTGKTVYIRVRFAAGSTTSFGVGAWSFALPAGLVPVTAQVIHGFAGTSTGSARWPVSSFLSAANGFDRIAVNGTGGVAATVPFTWATGDQMNLTGMFEIT